MDKEPNLIEKYSEQLEEALKLFLESLNESNESTSEDFVILRESTAKKQTTPVKYQAKYQEEITDHETTQM